MWSSDGVECVEIRFWIEWSLIWKTEINKELWIKDAAFSHITCTVCSVIPFSSLHPLTHTHTHIQYVYCSFAVALTVLRRWLWTDWSIMPSSGRLFAVWDELLPWRCLSALCSLCFIHKPSVTQMSMWFSVLFWVLRDIDCLPPDNKLNTQHK